MINPVTPLNWSHVAPKVLECMHRNFITCNHWCNHRILSASDFLAIMLLFRFLLGVLVVLSVLENLAFTGFSSRQGWYSQRFCAVPQYRTQYKRPPASLLSGSKHAVNVPAKLVGTT